MEKPLMTPAKPDDDKLGLVPIKTISKEEARTLYPAKPDFWKDLENNYVTHGDRVRIAAIGRALESQVAVMREALEFYRTLFEEKRIMVGGSQDIFEQERKEYGDWYPIGDHANAALAKCGEIEGK